MNQAPSRFSITQAPAKKIGERRWRWRVHLDGASEDLDQVKEVVWLLHDTFPDPVIRRKAKKYRSDNFCLAETGWGEFTIRARVILKGGEEVMLSHWLRLSEEVKPKELLTSRPQIFISYSQADRPVAEAIRVELDKREIDCIDPAALSSAAPIAQTLREAVERSDGIVVVSGTAHSPWVQQEIDLARKLGRPVLEVRDRSRGGSETTSPDDMDAYLFGTGVIRVEGIANAADAVQKALFDARSHA